MDGMSVTRLASMAGVNRETASRAIHRKKVTPAVAEKLGKVTRRHISSEEWYTMTPGQKRRAFDAFVKDFNRKELRNNDVEARSK